MAHPFKSQFIPSSLVTIHAAMIITALTVAGYLLSRKDQFLEFISRMEIDVCHLGAQAIRQIINQ